MITVKFSCRACGLKDVSIQVPARETPEVDVVYWVEQVVGGAIALEHHNRSPHCMRDRADDVKIPNPPEAEFIGQQIE